MKTINCKKCSTLIYERDSEHGYCLRCSMKILKERNMQIWKMVEEKSRRIKELEKALDETYL